jgi:ATP/maltotriose-dependent transcriptional regulator MalT
MHRLDEASAAALCGEAVILPCVAWACCDVIAGCEQVRDFDRAGEWCGRMGEFCERHGIALPLHVCKAKYAGVLTWQGRWDEAEAELHQAVDGIATARPPLVGDALVRLGELRRRQGRLEEAEELFTRWEHKPLAVLGRAELALERGDTADAAELADRYLRRFPDPRRIERCAGLELVIRAQLKLEAWERVDTARAELRARAATAGTRPVQAAVLATQGRVQAASGDLDAARCSFEDVIDLLGGAGAPYEIARVRLELAGVLAELGRDRRALEETEAALAAFRQLGAGSEQGRAEALGSRLRHRLGVADSAGSVVGPIAQLSPREREVVVLVADGLTNREIAGRLVLSEHTVHRHVTSILRKLRLPSRAAAASLATRHGMT